VDPDTAHVVPFPVSQPTPAVPDRDRSPARRWRHEALFEQGFVQTPTFFLRSYAHLKPFSLTHGEAIFVLHLMQYKWDEAEPFPSYKTIAAQMGVSAKQAQRLAVSLEQKKYLQRKERVGMSNRFDLTPLFDALQTLRAQQTAKKTAGVGA
jgi:hypothetical protein